MAREMGQLEREKEQQIAKLVAQYGSVEAVLAAIAKKKELAERNIERKADYQNQFFSPKSIGESMPGKPATTAQKLALFQLENPDALLSPRDSIKDQMTTTGVPNEEERALQYKEFSDDAALLGGLDEGEGGDPRVVEQAIGRREDLGTEALPVVQAMERGQRTEKEAEKRRLELGMRKQNYMTEGDREKYGASPSVTNESALQEKSRKERGGEGFSWGEPTAGGLGELPPSVRARLQEPGRGGEVDRERVASMNQGDIEQQMVEGMAQDQEVLKPGDVTTEEDERAVNEEFMATGSVAETEEVIASIAEATGNFSEATASSKEATGRYVRYDGATKKGITINKSYLEKLYNRKEKMALLQHIPQENRAALLFNWKLISKDDFTATQQQSAKEVLELEKVQLQVAELKNKTGKMTDQEKAQVTAASNGLAQAVKERRWDEAEGFQAQLNALMPDRKPLDFAKIQEGIDQKLKDLPALDRVKSQMGTQVWDGYFTFKNDLVKKIDLLKRSSAGSGELAKFLGASITEGANAGKTWADVLQGQGIASWDAIKDLPTGKEKELASKISATWPEGTQTDDIRAIKRSHYMGYVLPRLRLRIMENNYGKWHKTIEQELHGAQGKATAEHRTIVNENPESRPVEPEAEVVPEVEVESKSNLPQRPERLVPIIEEEQPVPEANPEEIQKIKERKALEEAEAESFPEAINRLFIKSDPAQLEKIKKYHKDNKPKSKSARKGYNDFLNFSVKQLEDAKGNKTVLEKLLKEHRKNQNKKVKAIPPQDHTFEDYNIAYINSLLNKPTKKKKEYDYSTKGQWRRLKNTKGKWEKVP